jgi:hypothetical protein
MGWAFSMHGNIRNAYNSKFGLKNLKGGDHWEDLGVDWRIILK